MSLICNLRLSVKLWVTWRCRAEPVVGVQTICPSPHPPGIPCEVGAALGGPPGLDIGTSDPLGCKGPSGSFCRLVGSRSRFAVCGRWFFLLQN